MNIPISLPKHKMKPTTVLSLTIALAFINVCYSNNSSDANALRYQELGDVTGSWFTKRIVYSLEHLPGGKTFTYPRVKQN